MKLSLSADGRAREDHLLGPDVAGGERPQIVIAPGVWQAAETTGAYTLVGCTVSPGFEFSGFEMAPQGWAPGPQTSI